MARLSRARSFLWAAVIVSELAIAWALAAPKALITGLDPNETAEHLEIAARVMRTIHLAMGGLGIAAIVLLLAISAAAEESGEDQAVFFLRLLAILHLVFVVLLGLPVLLCKSQESIWY